MTSLITAQVKESVAPLSMGSEYTDTEKMHMYGEQRIYDPYAGQQYSHYDLPEALKNQSIQYGRLILGLITDARYDFWASAICPWTAAGTNKVSWDEWRFETPRLNVTPHEAPVRFSNQNKRRRMESLVRKGTGWYMEIDYMRTPEGQIGLQDNLAMMAQAVREDVAFDTVYKLLNCHDWSQQMFMKFQSTDVDWEFVYNYEVENYAAIAKSETAFDVLVEQAKAAVIRNNQGNSADSLIMTQEFNYYIKMLNPKSNEFYRAGPDGVAEFKDNPDYLGQYRELDIFKAKFYPYLEGQTVLNPLRRTLQIGEYHPMFWQRRGQSMKGYTSAERDIAIYNQNQDKFVKELLKTAAMHCGVFNQTTNTYSQDAQNEVKSYNSNSKKKPNFERFFPDKEDLAYTEAREMYGKDSPPLSVATINDDNQWALAEVYGQMLPSAITTDDIKQVAESIIFKDLKAPEEASRMLGTLISVAKAIQRQKYNEAYWTALSNQNVMANLDGAGFFVGEKTPSYVNPIGTPHPILPAEWKPNSFGTLNLPIINLKDPEFANVSAPSGFASGAGLQEVEDHYFKDNSPWHKLACEMRPGMELARKIVAAVRAIAEKALPVDTDTRRPWFHEEDPLAVFLDNCLPLEGDPIFLKAVTEGKSGSESKAVIRNGHIRWAPLPSYADESVLYPNVNAFKTSGVFNAVATDDGTNLAYKNPITGQNVVLPIRLFKKQKSLPRYLQVLYVISGNTSQFWTGYLTLLSTDAGTMGDKLTVARDLANAILSISQKHKDNAQKMIVALNEKAKTQGAVAAGRALIAILGNKIQMTKVQDYYNEVDSASVWSDSTEPSLKENSIVSQNGAAAPITDGQAQRLSRGMERLEEIIQELYAIAAKKGLNVDLSIADFTSLDSLRNVNFFTGALALLPPPEGTRVAELSTEWTAIVTDFATNGMPETTPRGSVDDYPVTFTREQKADAQYYRAPLTMSYELLLSITSLNQPLIRPGDPRTLFASPVEPEVRNGQSIFPPEVVQRTAYKDIQSIIKSQNIAAFPQLFSTERVEMKMETKQNFSSHSSHEGNNNKKPGKKAKVTHFDDLYDLSDYEGESIEALGVVDSDELPSLGSLKRSSQHGAMPSASPNGPMYKKVVNEVLRKRFKKADKIENHLVRMVTYAALLLPIRLDTIVKSYDEDVHVPFNFCLWRNRITNDFLSFIILKRGPTTGVTYHNAINFMMQANADIKTVLASLTLYASTVIKNHRAVYVQNDALPAGYRGGCNTSYVRNTSDLLTDGVHRRSIIATLHPITETSLPKHASLTGFVPYPEVSKFAETDTTCHYWNWGFYERVLQLSDFAQRTTEAEYFSEKEDVFNVMCSSGAYYGHNRHTQIFDVWNESKGHRGPDGNGPGCAVIWNGTLGMLKKFDPRAHIIV